jgi:hypothetical protein
MSTFSIKSLRICFLLPSFLPCFALHMYLTLGFLSQCNKMTCPNCQTPSCYICRQVMKGYNHFSNQVGIFGVLLSDFYFFRFYLRCFMGIVIHVILYSSSLFSLTVPFFCRCRVHIIPDVLCFSLVSKSIYE